jgi:hypothetical protein
MFFKKLGIYCLLKQNCPPELVQGKNMSDRVRKNRGQVGLKRDTKNMLLPPVRIINF